MTPTKSARAGYPCFLSLPQTVLLHAKWFCAGLLDGFRWDVVARTATSDTEIRSDLFKSLLLNALSLASIYTFDVLLQPLVHDHPTWLRRNVGWCYKVLWLFPVVALSFYLNNSWCSLIAKRAFLLQHGSRAVPPPQPGTYTGMLTMLATSAYRAVMVLTSIGVSFALGALPRVGPFLSFAFMCWIDAYYCFEFIWIARGLSFAHSVRHLEERWAYYFAFGLPSAAVCTWGSGLANAASFALLFPAYIIMAMHARPLPHDPYNPLPTPRSGDPVRYPSPLIPIRLRIFAIVIWLNDLVVRIVSSTGGAGQHRHHPRAPSHSSEKAEEGVGLALTGSTTSTHGRRGHDTDPGIPLERTRKHLKMTSIDRPKLE